MNQESTSTTHVFDALGQLIHDWLFSIHMTMTMIQDSLVHAPYPSFPLPHSFPFGEFTIHEDFRWLEVDEETQTQTRRGYLVQFKFHGVPVDWGPLVWSLFSGRVQFGRVLLDGRLFYDPPPLERLILDAHFIVRCMLASLSYRQDIRISSRLRTESLSSATRTELLWHEIFEARTSDGTLLEEFGRRTVLSPPRSCSGVGCSILVPHVGPPLCMEHLITESVI